MRCVLVLSLALCACLGDNQGGANVHQKPSLDDPVLGNCDEPVGSHCDFDGWCTPTLCDPTELCWCGGDTIQCEPIDVEAPGACDSLPQGIECEIEGTGVCDGEPPGGGSCACDANGNWVCSNFCDGCPDVLPSSGDACTHACSYSEGVVCSCNQGAFACQ